MHEYASDVRGRGKTIFYLVLIAVLLAYVTQVVVDAVGYSFSWLLSAPSAGVWFGAVLWLYDRHLWKQSLGPVPLSRIPDLGGTWDATVTSSFEGGHESRARVRIEQTWSRMSVTMEVANSASSSHSLSAALNADSIPRGLTYVYQSQVQPAVADEDMEDHCGTAELRIQSKRELEGRYFTGLGRQREGSLRLQRQAEDPT